MEDDGTTAAIRDLLPAMPPPQPYPAESHQPNIGLTQHSPKPGIAQLAQNILLYVLVGISAFVVNLPLLQDYVLPYIPTAQKASGELTWMGLGLKAGLTVALFGLLKWAILP